MDNKKTIIIFSCFYEPYMSGAELAVKNIVERLRDRYSFVILTAKLNKKTPWEEERDGYKIVRIGLGRKFDKWVFAILAPFVAINYKPDVVHAVMESYAGIALWLYKLFGGVAKTVLTLQSGDLDMPEKQTKMNRFIWKKIHTSPDKVVAIGSSLRRRAENLGAKDVGIIPNGVDLKIGAADSVRPRQNRIICVGRLSAEKGHRYLLEAMRKVAEIINDAKLVLVGDGALEDELKKQAKKFNLDVEFMGKLPHEEALGEIEKSDVFVLPSLGEGMGIVIAEAQSLGVPVVATDVGGIPDLVSDGATGFLVPPKDSDALASALIKVLQMDEAEREKIVKNAKGLIVKYDWNVIAGEYDKLYQKL